MDFNFALNVAFILGTVSFIKARTSLKGNGAVAMAFVLAVALSFVPELLAAFPQIEPVFSKVLAVVQLFLTAPGLFDLAAELKDKSVG